jgi:hypothetical protein
MVCSLYIIRMSSEGGVVVWLGQKVKMVQDILSDIFTGSKMLFFRPKCLAIGRIECLWFIVMALLVLLAICSAWLLVLSGADGFCGCGPLVGSYLAACECFVHSCVSYNGASGRCGSETIVFFVLLWWCHGGSGGICRGEQQYNNHARSYKNAPSLAGYT